MSGLKTIGVRVSEFRDFTWQKYGFIGLTVMATDSLGRTVGPSGVKVEQQTVGAGEPFFRCWHPAKQPFVPMEAIDDVLEGLQYRINDTFPEMKARNFKIEEIIRKRSSHDNTQHWIIQTNQIDRIRDSYENNDEVKLGFAVRNGYNTGVALGVDIFTFRLTCSNGAFVKGRDLSTQSIRHIGHDPMSLLKSFQEGLMKAVQQWTEIMGNYQDMAHQRLNEKMADFLYKHSDIKMQHFPEYYQITPPAEAKKKKLEPQAPLVALTNEGKSVSLWENYNDMTAKLWRADKPEPYKKKDGTWGKKKEMSFNGIMYREAKLYDTMMYVLRNPEEFV